MATVQRVAQPLVPHVAAAIAAIGHIHTLPHPTPPSEAVAVEGALEAVAEAVLGERESRAGRKLARP